MLLITELRATTIAVATTITTALASTTTLLLCWTGTKHFHARPHFILTTTLMGCVKGLAQSHWVRERRCLQLIQVSLAPKPMLLGTLQNCWNWERTQHITRHISDSLQKAFLSSRNFQAVKVGFSDSPWALWYPSFHPVGFEGWISDNEWTHTRLHLALVEHSSVQGLAPCLCLWKEDWSVKMGGRALPVSLGAGHRPKTLGTRT